MSPRPSSSTSSSSSTSRRANQLGRVAREVRTVLRQLCVCPLPASSSTTSTPITKDEHIEAYARELERLNGAYAPHVTSGGAKRLALAHVRFMMQGVRVRGAVVAARDTLLQTLVPRDTSIERETSGQIKLSDFATGYKAAMRAVEAAAQQNGGVVPPEMCVRDHDAVLAARTDDSLALRAVQTPRSVSVPVSASSKRPAQVPAQAPVRPALSLSLALGVVPDGATSPRVDFRLPLRLL